MSTLTFRSLREDAPGRAWREVFLYGWPGWRDWFLARGGRETPTLDEAVGALRRYMPEMESLWCRLVAEVQADEDAARFLTFWTPPRYLVNCSQAAIVDADGPVLVRNYDLEPAFNESTLLYTRWRGRAVIGMVDGLCGIADGMNDAGLAVSLTFGGRVLTGNGFGAPMILRYLLEVCSDASQAMDALRAVPSHMAYNVTVLDRSGHWETLFLSPDRPVIASKKPFATNHQLAVEWPRHGRISRTIERAAFLDEVIKDPDLDGSRLSRAFLTEPLFMSDYSKGFGTIYTAAYRPSTGEMSLEWPGNGPHKWTFGRFEEARIPVIYPDSLTSLK